MSQETIATLCPSPVPSVNTFNNDTCPNAVATPNGSVAPTGMGRTTWPPPPDFDGLKS